MSTKCESLTRQYWGNLASSSVMNAVKSGVLAPARTRQCIRCGNPADIYDHRDYSKRLEVSPVCRSCNSRLGHAEYPRYLPNNGKMFYLWDDGMFYDEIPPVWV